MRDGASTVGASSRAATSTWSAFSPPRRLRRASLPRTPLASMRLCPSAGSAIRGLACAACALCMSAASAEFSFRQVAARRKERSGAPARRWWGVPRPPRSLRALRRARRVPTRACAPESPRRCVAAASRQWPMRCDRCASSPLPPTSRSDGAPCATAGSVRVPGTPRVATASSRARCGSSSGPGGAPEPPSATGRQQQAARAPRRAGPGGSRGAQLWCGLRRARPCPCTARRLVVRTTRAPFAEPAHAVP